MRFFNINFSTTTLAKFAAVYSGLVFGIYWIPLRALEDNGFAGLWATFIFSVVPLIFLTPLLFSRLPAMARAKPHFHICGIMVGGGYMLYASAFLYTEVIRVILLFYLMPIWGFLLARVVTGDPITPVRWLSMALGMIGMLVIFGIDSGFPAPKNIGDWMALTAGIMWAVASLMLLTDKSTPTRDYMCAFIFWGTVFSGVLALLFTQLGSLQTAQWQAFPDIAWWIALLAIFVLIPAAFATVFGPSHLNPGIAGLLFMTEISVAVASAAWLAGEPFGAREIIGVTLITLAGLSEPISTLVFGQSTRATTE
ncbi:MAG: DMT family transporter [Pseudomonadota bacterium]